MPTSDPNTTPGTADPAAVRERTQRARMAALHAVRELPGLGEFTSGCHILNGQVIKDELHASVFVDLPALTDEVERLRALLAENGVTA